MEVLANASVIIILQYINLLNQHPVHLNLKHCQLYVNMSIISEFKNLYYNHRSELSLHLA